MCPRTARRASLVRALSFLQRTLRMCSHSPRLSCEARLLYRSVAVAPGRLCAFAVRTAGPAAGPFLYCPVSRRCCAAPLRHALRSVGPTALGRDTGRAVLSPASAPHSCGSRPGERAAPPVCFTATLCRFRRRISARLASWLRVQMPPLSFAKKETCRVRCATLCVEGGCCV
ncbi:hypothetical protein TRVL_01825 [Trypanosoma vivax]|nr:hypothetical protein TRVL_01825 [Trypanosoma vivax]